MISLLSSLPKSNPPHILCIQEPYLHKGLPLQATGYTLFHHNPTNQSDQLLTATYVLTSFLNNTSVYQHPSTSGHLLTLTIHLQPQHNLSPTINIVNAYNQHSGPYGRLRTIPPQSLFTLKDSPTLVVGDLNIHHPSNDPFRCFSHEEVNLSEPYIQEALDQNFTLLNKPSTHTRFSPDPRKRNSAIDYAFANKTALPFFSKWSTSHPPSGSDHAVIKIQFSNTIPQKPTTYSPNWKLADWGAIQKDLSNTTLPPPNYTSFNQWFSSATNTITDTINTHTPTRRVSHWSKPWWSPLLTQLRKIFHSVQRAYRKGLSPPFEYKAAKNAYFKAIQTAKTNHWNSFVASASSSDIWKLKRMATKNQDKTPSFPDATNPQTLNEAMIKGFFPPKPTTHTPPKPLFFSQTPPITAEEVSNALKASSNNSAPGPDGYSYLPWKKVHAANPSLLPNLLTPLLQYGYHPLPLKHAYGIILAKPNKPDYSTTAAYRIIVLLQTVSKILERIVTVRLALFARTVDLIHPHQCGSVQGLSTADAATTLIHEVRTLQTAGLKASTLFLDIKGGFDYVVPSILATTLAKKHTPPYIIQWILSFLSERSITLLYKGAPKLSANIQVGVPQGSPISPLLFLIYIRPLHIDPSPGITLSYVDDFAITVASHSYQDNVHTLTAHYNIINSIGVSQNTQFSLPKTELMHWKRPKENSPLLNPPINLGGHLYHPKPEVRWIGFWLSTTFDPNTHFTKRIAAASTAFGILKQFSSAGKGLTPLNNRRLAVMAVLPMLTYGATIFVPNQSTTNKLQVFWNSVLRWVTNCFRTTPSTILCAEAAIPPLHLYMKSLRKRYAARIALASPAYNPVAARTDPSFPLLSPFRIPSHRTLLQGKPNPPKKWNSNARKGVKPLPIDDLCTLMRPYIEDNTTPINTPRAIKNDLLTDWNTLFAPPDYYNLPLQNKPHLFMNLNRFIAGRIHQMRAQKSYLAAHPSWFTENISPTCPLCLTEPQDFHHAIITCPAHQRQKDLFLPRLESLDEVWGSEYLCVALAAYVKATLTAYPPKDKPLSPLLSILSSTLSEVSTTSTTILHTNPP